jgi:DNA mismatch endonuclease (patch repair protein)
MARTPRYNGLTPGSERASAAARGSSRKTNTQPELVLRKALWRRGLRYRKNVTDLPGGPDIVFSGLRVIVFVDGDFWHGKNWETLKARLKRGHNSEYWIRKIQRNAVRDLEQTHELRATGWIVLRVWESEIRRNVDGAVARVEAALRRRLSVHGNE